jgi:Sir2- and TIR-associating SLOG family/SIR2-like domain
MDAATFIDQWSSSLELGSAAVFIGAGLSRRAEYPDWRSLLKDIADELGLDIGLEHDLAAVAQYSLNKAIGKRHNLTQLIVNHFPPKPDAPEPFRILARLPVRHVWTTNYDTLPEVAWRNERKELDVKSRNDDLGTDKPWAHAILYKMHGSVDHPSEVVIAKDDYELYRRDRPGFLQVLTGHLVSKQMLFLGFSFTDPNIAHLFASIREAFKDNGPEHYAIVRRPKLSSGPGAKKRLEIDKVRHTLWVDDLKRYGIQCVEVDEYENVDEILRAVELRLAGRSVFVSGSLPTSADPAQRDYVEDVAREVGRVIAKHEKRLVSGFGLIVGSATIAGALGVILAETAPNLEKSLLLRPFPQEPPSGMDLSSFQRTYRDGMISQAALCVFICGLTAASGAAPVIADGVMHEFGSAKRLKRVLLPIGATGGAAKKIWDKVAADLAALCPHISRKDFDLLNDPKQTPKALASIVGKVIAAVDKAVPIPKKMAARSKRTR